MFILKKCTLLCICK